jgi:predicted ATPase
VYAQPADWAGHHSHRGVSPLTQDAHSFIAALDEVDLARFRVVGAYARYDEAVRTALQDARQKILAGFEPPGRKRENHLIWAAPGTGKTYFVQQVAASLPSGLRYHELNLAKCTEPEFRSGLRALEGNGASLCLVDEIDAKPQEPWPYEVLLPYLDAAVDRGARFVFVLAGSSGASLEEIKQRIAARPKGTDLLSRIPTGHEYVIRPMSLGDRLLIVLSQLRQAGLEAGREIRAIEKLGLYYVALNPKLANARQLREFAVRAVERVPKSDDRVKYDHLFLPGDPENKVFWAQALPVAEPLVNTFVILSGEAVASGAQLVKPRPRSRTNLPRHLTSFIGRDREIEEVKGLLSTTGLLTFTGPAGVGKTRLALRVVADLVNQYLDGVWMAELGALSDPALVPKTVATALDVPEQPGRALTETLKDYLRPKSLLLVLDNCEHLLSACAQLADVLLKTCPILRILATSREPLGLPGEVIWRVPSLSIPSLKHLPPIEELTQYEAVHLFIDRATLSQPGFRITAGNAAVVAQLTHRLDGIPLAIELAAARVKALPLDAIANRLDDRFRLLTGGSRTGLPRHQTLRATLDWSYDLLSEQERILFRRLSVFAGGFTLEAAEQICVGEGVDDSDILDLLTRLVDKSLVIFDEPEGQGRYRLLESVRGFGSDRLQESGEASDVRRQHRDWHLALAEQADRELRGPRQAWWLERLETEHDNLRAALEWSKAEEDGAEAGVRLTGALQSFWVIHGHDVEGRAWFEGALARSSDLPPSMLPKVLGGATLFAWRQGDFERAIALGEKGLVLCRELDDKENGAPLRIWLGLVAARQGDYERATALLEQSVSMCNDLGKKWLTSMALACLARVLLDQGNYERAAPLSMQSLALARDAGDKTRIAFSLHGLATVALRRGENRRAAEYFRESLGVGREVGNRWIPAECLQGLAGVACTQQQYEKAARLFGAVEVSREAIGISPTLLDQPYYEECVTSTRGALGDAPFAAAWAEGRAMTLEQAIEYALIPESS